jgi:hypothetical protein
MADNERLMASLMLTVAACEQLMLECEAQAEFSRLSEAAVRLRDLAEVSIIQIRPRASPVILCRPAETGG